MAAWLSVDSYVACPFFLSTHFGLIVRAYDLPRKMKISPYLIRSEQAVLKHLIHVSTMAWLWLTGLVTTLYYITG
jgi:hypothetical protein